MKGTEARSDFLCGIFLVSTWWLLIFLVGFAGLVAWEFENIRLYREVYPVSCTVIAHEIDEGPSEEPGPYWIAIRYQYFVAGDSHVSDRFELWHRERGIGFATAGERSVVKAQYPMGLRTTCWVDPGDPGFAVLVREWRPAWMRWLGLAAVLVLIGAVVVLWSGWLLRSRGIDLRRVLRSASDGPVG